MKVLTDSWFGITASAEVVILQYQFDSNDTTFMIRTIIITKTTLMLLIKQKKKKITNNNDIVLSIKKKNNSTDGKSATADAKGDPPGSRRGRRGPGR